LIYCIKSYPTELKDRFFEVFKLLVCFDIKWGKFRYLVAGSSVHRFLRFLVCDIQGPNKNFCDPKLFDIRHFLNHHFRLEWSVEWVEKGFFSKSHLYLWFSLNLIFSKNFCILFFFLTSLQSRRKFCDLP
jgi:hypothetical protein